MNPNDLSGWLNIDSMLKSLESTEQKNVDVVSGMSSVQQLQEVSQTVEQSPILPPVVEEISSPVSTFSVWSQIPQEISPVVETTVSPMNTVPWAMKLTKKFTIPQWMRVAASAFSTLLVLLIWWWVMSVQYPEETRSLLNGITGTFSNLSGVTKNNIDSDGIVAIEDSESDTHWVAEEDPYAVSSPLADAMDTAMNTLPEDNQAEQLFDNVLSWSEVDNTIDFSTGTTWWSGSNNSGTQNTTGTPVSTYDPNFNLPPLTWLPTASEFKTQLLTLSENAQTAMTNLIWNSDVNLAKMRVVYKNSQAMTEEFTVSNQVTQEKVDQYNEILTLYNSVAQ